MVWAEKNPLSPRAQLSASNVLHQTGNQEFAINVLESAILRLPDSLELRLQYLRVTGADAGLKHRELKAIDQLALSASYSNEVIIALRHLTGEVLAGKNPAMTRPNLLATWNALARNPAYNSSNSVSALIAHQLGLIQAFSGNGQQAVDHFNRALRLSRNPGTGLSQAAILATEFFWCEALDQLDRAEELLANPDIGTGKRKYYSNEIERLRFLFLAEVRKNKDLSCSREQQGKATTVPTD